MSSGAFIMEKNKKRERNANFSREETDNLISLVERFITIIENKKSDSVTWQEKEKTWKTIETDYNRAGEGIYRDAKHLKSKYEALKRDTRKKCNLIRAGVKDAPSLTQIEQKVLILMSAEGGESLNDSDQLDISTTDMPVEFVGIMETNSNDQCENSIGAATDYDTPDDTKKIEIKTEKTPQKRHLEYEEDPIPSTSCTVDVKVMETPPKKWAEWDTSSLRSQTRPDLCKPREKRHFAELAERKLEIVELQKKNIQEELQEKILKKQIMEKELQYKKELFELEKEERLLKIEILKCELENKILFPSLRGDGER